MLKAHLANIFIIIMIIDSSQVILFLIQVENYVSLSSSPNVTPLLL